MPFQGLIGVCSLLLIAFLLSENKTRVPWKKAFVALAIQCCLVLIFVYLPWFQGVLKVINSAALVLQKASEAGSSMVFGYLGGGDLPFVETFPGASFILAFKALPIVIVMSALSALLFYWKVLPMIIRGFSFLLERSLGVTGVVGVGTAANVFVGMVEAPLCVRPYLASIARSELFILMTAGMATVAGTVMVLYATIVGAVIENALGHILVASLISAPAAIMFAMIMIPETHADKRNHVIPNTATPNTATSDKRQSDTTPATNIELTSQAKSSMDAITYGTEEGLKLFLNIVAMLLVLVSLVTLFNSCLSLLPEVFGVPLSLQGIFGWVMAPLMWALGLPWEEAVQGGRLMGIKTVLNEFLAYLELSKLSNDSLSDKSRLILIYALCGFANLGSLGIMVGGLSAMVPDRRYEILDLSVRSMISGTLATCMTGALVGLFYW